MSELKKDNLCPVCGYNFFSEFGFQPWNNMSPSDEICPSCGIQFGYHDIVDDLQKRSEVYLNWRKKWVSNGMQWTGGDEYMPKDWDPKLQLSNLDNK